MTAERDVPRRTKIVCTIGPASASAESLRALIQAGMNVARLNFSHGTQDEHARVIERVREISQSMSVPVAILQDLAGPKVRVGAFAAGSVELVQGKPFTLTTRSVVGDESRVGVSYGDLPRDVSPGDTLLLADGSITLEVVAVEGEDVRCRVVVGGALSAHKGINVPSGLFGLPILREKDLADLRFGIRNAVDFVGLSFVRTVEDVKVAKRAIAEHGEAPIVAKIETSAALRNFDAILEEADAVMIARGDLSIETPFARVPVVQKDLISRARRAAKPVITATQMLFSMVTAAYPTRAEVADVANAVLDGSDALMLSDETTVGRHPVRAVETMASIIREAETSEPRRASADSLHDEGSLVDDEALARGACELARRIDADFIATLTETGRTARLVAKYRPHRPVMAATYRAETYRRLALVRGITPILLPPTARTREEMVEVAMSTLEARGWGGKHAVFVSRDSIVVGEPSSPELT
jgi:pyruvate kinase